MAKAALVLPRVVVVGLGPGAPGLISAGALDAIAAIEVQFVRTRRHPSASLVPGAVSFDGIYDRAGSVPQVYESIVGELVRAASEVGQVLYAVPGSPLVAERTVELLRRDGRVETEIIPALSFLDLAWARLGVDPFEAGVRLIDGHRFAFEAAGESGPLLVAQCDSALVLSEVKLAIPDGTGEVTVLQRLGLADEAVTTVQCVDLDRAIHADHLTCVWIPRLAEPVAAEVVRFDELVRTLRQRCPWDRRQSHRSLSRYLLEETYEVLEAIEELPGPAGADAAGSDEASQAVAELGEAGFDAFAHLEEELGDLLFQVVFHATLAAEEGQFTLSDVIRGIHDKLVRRHPHVFGTADAATPEAVAANWEQIKKTEKGRRSLMDGVPGHLPALLYAHKVQRKAASVGFDWDGVAGAWPKITEELTELQLAMAATGAGPPGAVASGGSGAIADELGDVLFSVVNVARHLDIDPEAALRTATTKFARRFRGIEGLAEARHLRLPELTLHDLDQLWDEVKGRNPTDTPPADARETAG